MLRHVFLVHDDVLHELHAMSLDGSDLIIGPARHQLVRSGNFEALLDALAI